MNLLEKIQKLHQQQSIEQKDFSFKDLFKTTDVIELDVKAIQTKLVEKYRTETQEGYYTMLKLTDGKKTGCFSNGLFQFAKFFFNNCGLDSKSVHNEIEFDGYIKVKITKIYLKDAKTTYNFEVIGGDVKNILTNKTKCLEEVDIKYIE